ncbi:MAG TPA: 16S rRNA (cytosine(1402)-N(4))-methyltransferase RsmH, partial [Nitrospiria bacterium]|nr:16S rRNA (cytosine(1402)-N(4))-methyltransferase RsmH [Nitrospiria bacterium]
QDEDAVSFARERFKEYGKRVRIVQDNFKNLGSILKEMEIAGVDGVLFDLGVSTFQLLNPERGFSFRNEGPLDMRMDKSGGITAESLVNDLPEDRLVRIIREYGEERYANRIAKTIVRERRRERITSTLQLARIIRYATPASRGGKGIDPATRTFQAFRIAVNNELDILKKAIVDASTILKPAGRICVIAFHSLEDRIVKHTFRELSDTRGEGKGDVPCILKIITGKPIRPTPEEERTNPRSRSAKLRAAERYA